MYRLTKISIILQPATILKFHRALVERKFQKLYSKKTKQKPGRKRPSQEIIDLVLALKQRNPRYGYCRIELINLADALLGFQSSPVTLLVLMSAVCLILRADIIRLSKRHPAK